MIASNAGQKAPLDVVSYLHPCGPATPEKSGFKLGAWLKSLIRTMQKNAQLRVDRNLLLAMDDRQLDDIGITRGDIEDAINGTYRYSSSSVIQKPASIEAETVDDDDHKLAA